MKSGAPFLFVEGKMIRESQRDDWKALVDYLSQFGNSACRNALVEDGPDDKTDFKGLLEKFKQDDAGRD